jgi:hypothetical protein
LNELCFWTLSIVWCLKNKQNWGITNIDKISQYKRSQNSHKGQLLTTEQLTWVHTHKKPWSNQTPVAISDPATTHFTAHRKPRKHMYCIRTNELIFPRFFMSCEVCSGGVTYCHRCLTCFKCLCVYAPR